MLTPEQAREIPWAEVEAVRQTIKEEERVAFTVVSGSMEPVIMTGEQIEVAPIASIDELRTFDILLFWNGKLLICHYLWHINSLPGADGSRVVITRPLASLQGEDLPVPTPYILGKIVSHKIPFWRKLKVLLHKRSRDLKGGILS